MRNQFAASVRPYLAAGALASVGTALLLTTGCTAVDPDPTFAVRDSAGIEIIEIARGRVPMGPTVDATPEWVLGGEGDDDAGVGMGADGAPDLVLHRVVDAMYLGTEVVAIAEASTQQVILVRLASGEVWRWGGRGNGPEEFQELSRIYDVGGGRLGAYDRTRRRYLEFDENGHLAAELTLPNRGNGTQQLVRDDAGALYLANITGFPAEPSATTYRGTAPLIRLFEPADTITWIPGLTTFHNQVGAGYVIFGATSVLAAGHSGVWVGDTEHPEAVLWQNAGDPARIIRWTTARSRRVTNARKEELFARLEASLPVEQRAMIDEMRRYLPFAEEMPTFGSLLVDTKGRVWIGSPIPPEVEALEEPWPEQDWLVIDLAASRAELVTTPPGLRVLRVGGDYLLGVHTDELGIETVRRYRLSRFGSGS